MEINNRYDKVINDFKDNLKKLLGDELKSIFLIGSYLSKKYIDNWSDIDLIIVVNQINDKVINCIKLESTKYDIKIGITLYSLSDLKSGKIDSKTAYYFYLYNMKSIDLIYNTNVKIPTIKKEDMIDKTSNLLYNNMHVCKRSLLYKNKNRELGKTQFKNIYSIIKTFLIINGIYPLNYEETFELFSKNYNFEKFDYMKFIDDYRNDTVDYAYIDMYSMKLIKFVEEN